MEFLPHSDLDEDYDEAKIEEGPLRPLKILMTVPDLEDPGGVANYYNQIMPYWYDEVKYYTVGRRVKEKNKLEKLKRLVMDYISFYKLISLNSYDLIQVNPSLGKGALPRDALYILIGKVKKRKVVVFIRGWDEDYEKTINNSLLLKYLFIKVYNMASATIVLGGCFEKQLKDWGYKSPIFRETTIVSNKVFDEKINNVFQAPYRILFLARMQKAKGVYIVVETIAELNRRGIAVTATLAGDGDELNDAIAYANRLGLDNVRFSGYLSGIEKAKSFGNSDVFFFPTYYGEGMPNCVLEAMAYGLPVVIRPQGGLKDFFENGKMGFSTTSKDPLVFADLIEKLVATPNLLAKVGTYNREYAERRFKASSVEGRIRDIWNKVYREK